MEMYCGTAAKNEEKKEPMFNDRSISGCEN